MPKRIRSIADMCVLETEDYLVIHKPAGLASLHEREATGDSVQEWIEKDGRPLQLCHRLDRDTSGALLLAKHPDAYRHAAVQFQKRKVEKVYHCVSEGVHYFNDQLVDMPLHVTRSGRNSINYLKGKESSTVVNTLEHFGHYTLIEARPVTGRMHQIRAHLSAINAPLAGDANYGGHPPLLSRLKKNFSHSKMKDEQPMIHRFALHAYSLRLPLSDGNELSVVVPYPRDMAVFLKLLRKYDAPSSKDHSIA